MKTTSISKLKACLSEYLDRVRRGEEIVITDRGRPVGKIVPIEGSKEGDARLNKLVRDGVVSPPSVKRKGVLSPPKGKKPSGVLAALLKDREEGR